jgi:hypothetical protein
MAAIPEEELRIARFYAQYSRMKRAERDIDEYWISSRPLSRGRPIHPDPILEKVSVRQSM